MDSFSFAVGTAQGLIALVLWLAGVSLTAFAFIDALTRAAMLYPAAGKRTKQFWTVLLGVTLAFAFLAGQPLSLFFLPGVIAAAVYLTDVRPALRQVQGHGGGRHQGPYGPW